MVTQVSLDRQYQNWVPVPAQPEGRSTRWPGVFIVVSVGYLAMSRSFAHVGIPQLSLYVGEMAIGAFILSQPRSVFDRWIGALSKPGPLFGFAVMFALSLMYGVFQLAHGIAKEYPIGVALQSFAFHYYPICFFVGLWAAGKQPFTLRRLIRAAAWVNGIYGLAYLVMLGNFPISMPGAPDVSLFGQPAGSAVAVLGLLCMEPRPLRVMPLLILNLFVMLGLQVRAEFVGFGLGLVLWVGLTRQFGRFLMGCGVVAALLVVGLVADFRMPAPYTRGGEISSADIIGRVLAPVAPDLAAEYTPNVRMNAGTAEWRLNWWRAIWEVVNRSTESMLFGKGYGYPLSGLIGARVEDNLRTPHNVFFYALGYGGWMGVSIFLALQAALVWVLILAFQRSRSPVGLVLWIALFSSAFFQNFFETPYGAIPYYFIAGLAAAPVLEPIRLFLQPKAFAVWTAASRVRVLA